MADYASRPWGVQYLREEIYRNPKQEMSYNAMMDAISDWREFRICEPTVTFGQNMTLHFDNLTLELEAVMGRHALDSIVVRIPEARVIFIADSYYPPPLSIRDEDDIDLAIAMMESFVSDDYDIYVDGHGPPRNREEFVQVIEYEKKRQGMFGT
jgi:glyoxylase-like metal-dependent hydrolase (beta-lactamase superfamily II)